MKNPISIWLAAALMLYGGQTPASEKQLAYQVSYQGLFTAGLEVDIGRIDLQLAAADQRSKEILMRASTRDFEAAELLLPVRFCYRSLQNPHDPGMRQADWWSRIGDKASRGRLLVDNGQQRVVRLHSERRLEQAPGDDDFLPVRNTPVAPNQDRDEAPFPGNGTPLDRLGMIQHLRALPLTVGQQLRLPVSDGRKLKGYEIEVEAEEPLAWNGRSRPTLRLHLLPVQRGKSEDRPTRLWLTADEQRLPLLLRSDHPHGSFEMRLVNDGTNSGVQCPVPEAVGLELPEA